MPLISDYKLYKTLSQIGKYLPSYPLKKTLYKAYNRVISVFLNPSLGLSRNIPLIRVYKAYKTIFRIGSYLPTYLPEKSRYNAYKRVLAV
jgi:hypothetical protein